MRRSVQNSFITRYVPERSFDHTSILIKVLPEKDLIFLKNLHRNIISPIRGRSKEVPVEKRSDRALAPGKMVFLRKRKASLYEIPSKSYKCEPRVIKETDFNIEGW